MMKIALKTVLENSVKKAMCNRESKRRISQFKYTVVVVT